jgi:hypothetical protein
MFTMACRPVFTSGDPMGVCAGPPPEMVSLTFSTYNPQVLSPFYNGLLPPELREQIFQHALSEYIEYPYPPNTDYTRPEHLGKKRISTTLLRTCKRIYLETARIPARNKSHVFWHFAGPTQLPYFSDERAYFRRFTHQQMKYVKEIHLYTQQFWLDASFPALCRQHYLKGVEKVKITLRRGDWWSVENNAPLAITPYRSWADVASMRADWRILDAGGEVEWDEACWGSAFQYLKGLRELEMELETFEWKKDELDEIVRHAVQWRFPMGEGKVLSAEGLPVEVRRWRGPPCGWTNRCHKCEGRDKDCQHCEEIMALNSVGKGPMLILMSLKWKLVASS